MSALTLAHVLVSLLGIVSGIVVVRGFVASRHGAGWSAVFLWSTLVTSVTGFLFFPLQPFTPAHVFGAVSLVVLGPTFFALYSRGLSGGWRRIYVIGALVAFYLNFFVLIVQMFRRVPFLHALAPTQSEPPFAVAQLLALIAFIVLGVLGVKRFRPAAVGG